MANVLLGVTGSVAAIRTPELFQALGQNGHQVKVVATQAALYFFDPASLGPQKTDQKTRNPDVLILDEDEWPGRAEGQRYQRKDPVLHIELRKWADLFLIAPLDANTLAKLANGLADNCLTCVWRAWNPERPVILAPAMNTVMWEHPFTQRHLEQLAGGMSKSIPPPGLEVDQLIEWIHGACKNLLVVAPQSKPLACGDVGMGGMANVEEIISHLDKLVPPSPTI